MERFDYADKTEEDICQQKNSCFLEQEQKPAKNDSKTIRKEEQLDNTKEKQKRWSDNSQMNGGVHKVERSMTGQE